VVAGSAGPFLFRRFREQRTDRSGLGGDLLPPSPPADPGETNPLDRFVATILARVDAALTEAAVRFKRFEPTFDAQPRVDFLALAQLVGLGSPGPFGMLIHAEHGPWWALRGAWLVDAEVDPPLYATTPCAGCSAPCVGGWARACGIAQATAETRARCVVGRGSRYDEDQTAYHHDRGATSGRPSRP
jgi:hypothetical protein